jgi:hypothetical protein
MDFGPENQELQEWFDTTVKRCAKIEMTEEDVLEWCKLVAENYPSRIEYII